MDSNTNSPSANIDEAKGTFRKLTNDAVSRKYRRHSPASRSSSSDALASAESPKRVLSASPTLLKEDKRSKHDNRDDRVSSRSEHGRHIDSQRYSSRGSQGYSRSYGHSREGKYVDEEERSYSRLSSWSVRESKGSVYSNYKGRGGDHNRSRDYYHDKDKYNRDRSNAAVRDNRDKYDDCDRRARDRDYRDERRDHRRSSRDYKSDRIISSEESRRKQDDVISRREGSRQEEANKCDPEAEYKPKHSDEEKKKFDEGDHKEPQGKSQDDSPVNRNEESAVKRPKLFSFDSNGPATGSNQGHELLGKVTSEQASVNMPECAGNLDAAKVAAMKAAELVNKNLIGTGVMTADQKKKLLWGNKKNTSTEESSHRWDSAIFPDLERQEKFNKLMGVKGDVKVDQNPKSDPHQTEKQRELQLDLEKQYTAGLRRRDGRTVGLGL